MPGLGMAYAEPLGLGFIRTDAGEPRIGFPMTWVFSAISYGTRVGCSLTGWDLNKSLGSLRRASNFLKKTCDRIDRP